MWAPHGYSTGTATAGRGAQAAPTDMHMRAHAHALPGVHMHTHTEQSPPPSHRHPAPPSPAQYRGEHPLPPGGSGDGWQGAISMVWGLLAPAAPRCCRARRGQPHTGHPVAGREKRSCARQGVDGGAGGCRGAGVQWVLGDTLGCGDRGQWLGWVRSSMQGESGPTRTRAMREGACKHWRKLAFLPQTTCLEPLTWAWGVPEGGCHPQPGQGGLVALHVGTWFPARGE